MSFTTWRDGVWTVDRPDYRIFGLPVGARATVLRVGDGKLALISPVAAPEADWDAVRALGEVGYVVAPNLTHYRYLPEAKVRFPGARVLAAPGLRKKRPALPIDDELGGDALPGVELHLVAGMPGLNEVAFRAGDTLVLTDLCFNIRATSSLLLRAYLRITRSHGRLATTLVARNLVKDRAAFKASCATLIGWGCDRVIVTHGDVLAAGGQDELPTAFG
jgi:hypothetical protein